MAYRAMIAARAGAVAANGTFQRKRPIKNCRSLVVRAKLSEPIISGEILVRARGESLIGQAPKST